MSLFDTLGRLFPDFDKARVERRKIRQRYRKNLAALDRHNGEIYIITTKNYSPEYLPNWVEKQQIKTDHLIQEHGSARNNEIYRYTREDGSEIVSAMKSTIRRITIQNWVSLLVEIVFILFVILCLSLALLLGIVGIETAASEVGNVI